MMTHLYFPHTMYNMSDRIYHNNTLTSIQFETVMWNVANVFPTVLMCMFMLLKNVVLITAEGYQLGFSRRNAINRWLCYYQHSSPDIHSH